MGGDRRSKLLEQAGWIGERLAEVPELTLGEIRSELVGRGIEVSYASVWRAVRKLGLRHKKRTIFATEQDRPDVAVAREVWRAAQARLDFTSLVFVDETGTTTSMTRLRGWALKGKPLLGEAPHGHWMTSTFVAGLRHDGIAAPMLIDTPMTGRIFQQCLVPVIDGATTTSEWKEALWARFYTGAPRRLGLSVERYSIAKRA